MFVGVFNLLPLRWEAQIKKDQCKKKHILKVNDKIFNQEIEKIIINSFHDYVVTKLSKKFRKTYQLSDKSIELAISNNKKNIVNDVSPREKKYF